MRSRLSRRKATRVEEGDALRRKMRVHSGGRRDLEIYSAPDAETEPVEEKVSEKPRRAIVSINGKDVGVEIISRRRSA